MLQLCYQGERIHNYYAKVLEKQFKLYVDFKLSKLLSRILANNYDAVVDFSEAVKEPRECFAIFFKLSGRALVATCKPLSVGCYHQIKPDEATMLIRTKYTC